MKREAELLTAGILKSYVTPLDDGRTMSPFEL